MADFPLVASPAEMRDGFLNDLFEPTGDIHGLEDLRRRSSAFKQLIEQFAATATKYGAEDLVFDPHALRLMLGRFQRDAFGVGRFFGKLPARLGPDEAAWVREEVSDLGLRVGSSKPRRTRIVAVFSLWMCVFRPVALRYEVSREDKLAGLFAAAANFWIARSYLSKFGEVLAGREMQEHVNRVVHDLTYRDVSLSSLELFYCGMFKPRAEEDRGAGAA